MLPEEAALCEENEAPVEEEAVAEVDNRHLMTLITIKGEVFSRVRREIEEQVRKQSDGLTSCDKLLNRDEIEDLDREDVLMTLTKIMDGVFNQTRLRLKEETDREKEEADIEAEVRAVFAPLEKQIEEAIETEKAVVKAEAMLVELRKEVEDMPEGPDKVAAEEALVLHEVMVESNRMLAMLLKKDVEKKKEGLLQGNMRLLKKKALLVGPEITPKIQAENDAAIPEPPIPGWFVVEGSGVKGIQLRQECDPKSTKVGTAPRLAEVKVDIVEEIDGGKMRAHLCEWRGAVESPLGWCSAKFLICLAGDCGICGPCSVKPAQDHPVDLQFASGYTGSPEKKGKMGEKHSVKVVESRPVKIVEANPVQAVENNSPGGTTSKQRVRMHLNALNKWLVSGRRDINPTYRQFAADNASDTANIHITKDLREDGKLPLLNEKDILNIYALKCKSGKCGECQACFVLKTLVTRLRVAEKRVSELERHSSNTPHVSHASEREELEEELEEENSRQKMDLRQRAESAEHDLSLIKKSFEQRNNLLIEVCKEMDSVEKENAKLRADFLVAPPELRGDTEVIIDGLHAMIKEQDDEISNYKRRMSAINSRLKIYCVEKDKLKAAASGKSEAVRCEIFMQAAMKIERMFYVTRQFRLSRTFHRWSVLIFNKELTEIRTQEIMDEAVEVNVQFERSMACAMLIREVKRRHGRLLFSAVLTWRVQASFQPCDNGPSKQQVHKSAIRFEPPGYAIKETAERFQPSASCT